MNRYVLEVLGLIAILAAVTAKAADARISTLPSGSYVNYMGSFAPQESVELGLHKDGRATYIVSRRQASSRASAEQRQVIFGRWQEYAGIVTVRVDQESTPLTIEYKIVECLPYEYNTEVRCSLGIEPTDPNTPHMLRQSFWSVVTISNQFERP